MVNLNSPMEIAMRDMTRLIDLANSKADTIPDVINANGPMYGAKPDAVDNTAALQKAIDAAKAAGRSEVYLSPGHYDYTSLTNTDGIVIVGDGVTLSGSPTIPVVSTAQLADIVQVNVKSFGAVGDGVTDDYEALQAVASYVNSIGGGRILFPPGNYYIDRYKIFGGPNQNDVSDIVFQNCDFIEIIGDGAVVSVKGDFKRTADYTIGGTNYSYSDSVIPFDFVSCKKVKIQGIEVNGNVQQMTADNVAEGTCYGIRFADCDEYLLTNVTAHHFATDGIYCGFASGTRSADQKATMINVSSYNNGRQGLSIGALENGVFIDCDFSRSGVTDGSYPGHSPRAGVQIEPEWNKQENGNYHFLNCSFIENAGSIFTAIGKDEVKSVVLDNCRMIAGDTNTSFNMLFDVDRVSIQDCEIDVKKGYIYPVFGSDTNENKFFELKNSTVRTSGNGLAVVYQTKATILIQNNRFIGEHEDSSLIFFNLNSTAGWLSFEGNKVFIPKTMYDGSFSSKYVVRLFSANYVARNEWYTDLTVDDVSDPGDHFAIIYGNKVLNDRLLSGTFIRSSIGSTWNNDIPYSKGFENLGDSYLLGGRRRFVGTATPSTGSYTRGDRVDNINYSAGGISHWLCITGGSPGTWIPVQGGALGSVSSTPPAVGFLAVVGGNAYISVGTSSPSDWKQITT